LIDTFIGRVAEQFALEPLKLDPEFLENLNALLGLFVLLE
jgi:hypothetical protein